MSVIRNIADEYRKIFVSENQNVWPNIRTEYFSIDDDNIYQSTMPFILDKAKVGLVIYRYTYTVISAEDYSFCSLFIKENGEAEDYIEIDGWRFRFDRPITSMYRTYSRAVCISNGVLTLVIKLYQPFEIADKMKRLWELFKLCRKCTTQLELDFLCKMYNQECDLIELSEKNLRQEYEIEKLQAELETHKNLIKKIEQLVDNIPTVKCE